MTVTAMPNLSRRWRLKIALEQSGLTAADMATELGVTRQTVSRWMTHDDVPIRADYLDKWAAKTGVGEDWLRIGYIEPTDEEIDAIIRLLVDAISSGGSPELPPVTLAQLLARWTAERARRDSNSQPSDPHSAGSGVCWASVGRERLQSAA